MIIPQIADNLTGSGNVRIPEVCPVCGGSTQLREVNDVKSLYCTNPECQAKHVKRFAHFVSRDAMNIEGLSEATLEKFIQKGLLKDFTDLYHLDKYKDIISGMEGFGEKSCDNLLRAVETSRKTTMPKLIYSLGISGIGLSNAKMIVKAIGENPDMLAGADRASLEAVYGVGEVLADAFVSYFENEKNKKQEEEHSFEGVAKEVAKKTEDSSQEVVEKEEVKQIEGIKEDTPVETLKEEKIEEELKEQADLLESEIEQEKQSDKEQMPDIEEESEEIPEYSFVNVMEHVVSKKAKMYMEKFGNCMCPRCVADVKAYTLTHLPAKYVVIQSSGVFPLLNFYADKYSDQVLVELTKACIVVKENPHH